MQCIGKFVVPERFVVGRGDRMGQWRVTANGFEVSFWGDLNVQELDSDSVIIV